MRQDTAEIKTEPTLRPLFRKQFRWKFYEGDHAEKTVITPELAAEMMKRNVDEDYQNRPQTAGLVSRYARQMAAGNWIVTGEAIIFSSDGVLLNGQHRLTACMESGHAFTTWVIYGIDRAAFKHMDMGKKRTGGDIFAIEGIPNYSLMAAATKWFERITRFNGGNMPMGRDGFTEASDLLDIYYANEGLQDSVWISNLIAAEGESLTSNSMMTALHYLFAQKNRGIADDFMRKVITGVGIVRASEPEQRIRKWLLNDNRENKGARASEQYRAAYVTLAWNARRTNKEIKIFRWRTEQAPNAPFPTIR